MAIHLYLKAGVGFVRYIYLFINILKLIEKLLFLFLYFFQKIYPNNAFFRLLLYYFAMIQTKKKLEGLECIGKIQKKSNFFFQIQNCFISLKTVMQP